MKRAISAFSLLLSMCVFGAACGAGGAGGGASQSWPEPATAAPLPPPPPPAPPPPLGSPPPLEPGPHSIVRNVVSAPIEHFFSAFFVKEKVPKLKFGYHMYLLFLGRGGGTLDQREAAATAFLNLYTAQNVTFAQGLKPGISLNNIAVLFAPVKPYHDEPSDAADVLRSYDDDFACSIYKKARGAKSISAVGIVGSRRPIVNVNDLDVNELRFVDLCDKDSANKALGVLRKLQKELVTQGTIAPAQEKTEGVLDKLIQPFVAAGDPCKKPPSSVCP